jgi:CBS domain containing-hemolysin-like protein
LSELAVRIQGFLLEGPAVDWSRLQDPDMILRIVIQLLLLSASAFFSGSEVALFSLSRMDLDRLRREGHPQAANLFGLLEQPRRLIISILCGNELVNVAAAANMATILLALFDETRAGVLNLLVMVPLLLLFGEVTPKTVAISDPVRLATRVTAAPMAVWVRLVTPLRRVVRLLAESLTTRIVGEEASRENILVADEIRLIAKELEERGELRLEERALVDSFLEAGATEVVEIMRPRTRMAFVNASATVPEALARFRSVREGRLPVYRGQRDNLVGMLRAEDFMQLVLDGTDLETVALEDLIRPPVVVPPTKKLDEVLDYFRAHDVSAAVVMSEFGGVEGLVTLRMLLDAMFRPVTGAHLDPERFAGPDPGTFDVPGDMKLTDFNLLTGFNVDDPRMTTVGGLVYRHLDRVPDVDDRVSIEGIGFTVLEMDELRIARVRAGRGVEVDREEDDA